MEVILCFPHVGNSNLSLQCRDRESLTSIVNQCPVSEKSLLVLAILSTCVALVVPVNRRKPAESADRVISGGH